MEEPWWEQVRWKYMLQMCKRAAESLEEKGWKVKVASNRDEAREHVLSLLPEPPARIAIPGSVTIRELGLPDVLRAKGYTVVEHWTAKPEDRMKVLMEEPSCEVFLHSANALSTDGHLVIVDFYGNRIAGSSLGPKNLIIVAGANKITETLDEAIARAWLVASEMNAIRFNKSVEDVITFTLILHRPPPTMNAAVVLVADNLGF